MFKENTSPPLLMIKISQYSKIKIAPPVLQLRYVGRAEHATSAVGVGAVHKQEAQDLIDATFA